MQKTAKEKNDGQGEKWIDYRCTIIVWNLPHYSYHSMKSITLFLS